MLLGALELFVAMSYSQNFELHNGRTDGGPIGAPIGITAVVESQVVEIPRDRSPWAGGGGGLTPPPPLSETPLTPPLLHGGGEVRTPPAPRGGG